jgi:hypothetical protein
MKRFASFVCGIVVISALMVVGCGGSDSSPSETEVSSTPTPEQSSDTVTEAADNSSSAEEQIRDLMTAYGEAFTAKDAGAVCDLMSPKAISAVKALGYSSCEEVVTSQIALVDSKEIERVKNPESVKITGNTAVIKFTSGDDGTAELVDGKWMIGE